LRFFFSPGALPSLSSLLLFYLVSRMNKLGIIVTQLDDGNPAGSHRTVIEVSLACLLPYIGGVPQSQVRRKPTTTSVKL
jgi:hypothetical protein